MTDIDITLDRHELNVRYTVYPDDVYGHPDTGQTLAVNSSALEIDAVLLYHRGKYRHLSLNKMTDDTFNKIQQTVYEELQ